MASLISRPCGVVEVESAYPDSVGPRFLTALYFSLPLIDPIWILNFFLTFIHVVFAIFV